MEFIVNRFSSWINSGLALELSHFFIVFLLFILTVVVFYKLLLILENRKFVTVNMFKKTDDVSWLPNRIQDWIKEKEKVTNIKVFPFISKYLFVAMLLSLSSLIIPFVSEQYSQYMLLVNAASLFICYMPFHMLKTFQLNRKNKIGLEVPEYLESFALLKQQQTLFQATINSARFAGPTIKPYVEQLVLDVQLHPGSSEPYQDFAKKINRVEVSTFMNTMVETARVDQSIESELITEELRQIERMRSDVYAAIIEEVEAKVGTRNMLLSIPILLIILVFMFFTIGQIISNSGIM